MTYYFTKKDRPKKLSVSVIFAVLRPDQNKDIKIGSNIHQCQKQIIGFIMVSWQAECISNLIYP